MTLHLQPVKVATGFEEDGVLVFDEQQRLAAVLVQLSDHDENAPGHWFLEAGFGPMVDATQPTFVDLEAAQDWIAARLSRGRGPGAQGGLASGAPLGPTHR